MSFAEPKYEFSITPEEFLNRIGWQFKKRGRWLSMRICPFCGGGRNNDRFTFVVHSADGGYACQRAKCGASGSFWQLMQGQGYNPREFLIDSSVRSRKKKRKKFVYGKK